MISRCKYEIITILLIVVTYNILGYFLSDGFLGRFLLTTFITLIFFNNIESIKESCTILIPITLISVLISELFVKNKEIALLLGCSSFFGIVFLYGKIKIIKAKKKR